MHTLTVCQWGNSQAVRLDKATLAQAGIGNGSQLSVTVTKDGSIVLTPLRNTVKSSLIDDLFAGYNVSYKGEELLDGGPQGEELI